VVSDRDAGMDGLALLSALRVDHPTPASVTGQGSIERRPGDEGRRLRHLTKPLDPPRPGFSWRGRRPGQSAREVHRLRRELRHRGAFGRLVAPAMQEVTRRSSRSHRPTRRSSAR
jgi:hypothetical protein